MELGVGSVKRPGLWVVLVVVLVVSALVGGASARHLVVNQSGAPISIEQASVNEANSTESVVVGPQSRLMLPAHFAGSSLLVRNQLTGGVFGPFTLRRNAAMLVQSTGLLSNIVTVLLGTIIQGVLTALTTLVAAL